MGYSKQLFQEAIKNIQKRKNEAEHSAEVRFQELTNIEPRFKEIKNEIAKTGMEAVKVVLSNNSNAEEYINNLHNINKKLQDERTLLLTKMGLDTDFLKPRYTCNQCKDTGYLDGQVCDCLEKELRNLSYKTLNKNSGLSLMEFSNFNVNYYPLEKDENGISPREKMKKVVNFCEKYANDFSLNSSNILLFGRTGLGKTHLSLAIAKEVINKGYGVIYSSAPSLMDSIEKEKFSSEDQITIRSVLECDLLVLDDLGAEFTTPFVVSSIYNIINSRINSQKPTIISTNLDFKELETKYSERLVSRFLGEYTSVKFLGNDIRLIKKTEKREVVE